MLKIFNLERVNTLPGCWTSRPHDRAIVVDTEKIEYHIITNEPQPATVYRGTLSGAHAYIKANHG